MDKCEFEYLGPYKIQSVLGRGGMGAVYKGIHTKSGEVVAVKVIAPGVSNQMRFRRRFAAEIETLMRLKHPHIVQLIGVGEEQGLLFYVMEYVDGHSLHDHLRQHKSVDWTEVIQVGIEVTAALKHAHDMGIIHRDIKPANLMVDKQGHIKLTDFGIAKLFGATEMTVAGSVIGTADYMPPEQAEGKAITVRSDLYSLGSVMFALLAGRAPFAGKSVPEVLYSVRYSPAPDSSPFAPHAPTDLHQLIAEMLEKDPLKRPPTALVIGNRLKAIQQGMAKLEADRARSPDPGDQPLGSSQVAKELTSIDLDDQAEELQPTGHLTSDEQPTAIASESVLERLGRELTAPTAVGDLADETGLSGELAKTHHSQASALPSTETPLPASTSHYTPITEADKQRYHSELFASEAKQHVNWLHYASIAAMVMLLIGLIVAAFVMLKQPTADAMYADLMSSIESGDKSSLKSAIPEMREFLELYPEDQHVAEVKQWLDEAELVQAADLIRFRALQGVSRLPAIEQAFLACIEAMTQDRDAALKKFDAFLSVYRSTDGLNDRQKRFVELARHASETLATRSLAPNNPAIEELEQTIRATEATRPSAELPGFYRSVIELYGDKPWAKDSIARVRAKLGQ